MYLQYRLVDKNYELIQTNNRPDEDNKDILDGKYDNSETPLTYDERMAKIFSEWRDGDILVIADSPLKHPKLQEDTLVEMTREEVCETGDLSVLDIGEVYQEGAIIKKEKPKGVKIEWEYPNWVEKASQIEIDTQRVNKQYNEYMQLANTYDTELMKEEGVWENFRTFIDECRVYLTRIKKGIEVRSSIPMPSKNLEKFFENSFKEVDKNV